MPLILASAIIGGIVSFFWLLGWGGIVALFGASIGASVSACLAGALLAIKRNRNCKNI